MKSRWTTWLREMAAGGMGGNTVTLRPITRGLPYQHMLSFDADFSADTFTADLRMSPDADAALQAVFDITTDVAGTGSVVVLGLTEAAVNALTIEDDDADGVEELIFSLYHTPTSGTEYRAIGTTIAIVE